MKLILKHLSGTILCICLAVYTNAQANAQTSAQDDTTFIRKQIDILTSPKMAGRGYVNNGMQKAARHIAKEMKTYGLLPLGKDYFQPFKLPIVQFPKKMQLKLNGKSLDPGTSFLIDPFSKSWRLKESKVVHIDFYTLLNGLSKVALVNKVNQLKKEMAVQQHVMVLHNTDSLKKWMDWKGIRALSANLPKGHYIVPMEVEPLWFPAAQYKEASIIYIYGEHAKQAKDIVAIQANVNARQEAAFQAENVVGYIPAKVPTDTYIVFTAHYDHIGMMGKKTMFAGASDNASGTAMMLNLARYYARNQGNYNVLFIACAAEEAGLLGAEYFAKNPMVPLNKMKFLINLDIWGDATNGIGVVNGKVFEQEFQYVLDANKELSSDGTGFFKEIRKGEEAFNSDHAPFYAKGVRSFFFFTMGGPGNYHDVEDVSSSLQLTNLKEAGQLIKLFVGKLGH